MSLRRHYFGFQAYHPDVPELIASLYTLSASLIWGVNTLFLLSAGLDIFGVFVAERGLYRRDGHLRDSDRGRGGYQRAAGLLPAEHGGAVPGDAGRRLGVALLGGGLLWFCLMSVVLGLGFTFYSGAVEAWLVDALKAVQYEGDLEHVLARAGIITTNALMLVGTVGAAACWATSTWRCPSWGRALLLALVCAWAYASMHDIGYMPRALTLAALPREMGTVARESVACYGSANPARCG